MSDMGDDFRALREMHRERREQNLASANPAGWTKHTEFHWSRMLNGKRLDYWPSRNKFMYEGHLMVGNVQAFIRKQKEMAGGY